MQNERVFLFQDVLRQVDDFEDAFETDHGGAELDGRARESLQCAVELTEIRTEGDDGADGECILNDVPAAEAHRRAPCPPR